MKIKELKLFTSKLLEQKEFFKNILGFEILAEDENEFSIQIGLTKFSFQKTEKDHKYHYCFLIPSNKLGESIEWLKERLELIKIEGNRITQKFESWNAESVYFYDGAGNLAEFIVRYDLKNDQDGTFNLAQILSVNEIGMPTNDVKKINKQLEEELNSKFWKGDLKRFGVNGTQEGLFLLVNNELKKIWFPTKVNTESAPFQATIDVDGKEHQIIFEHQAFKIIEESTSRV
ncbi:MAG TPA: glyoxalase [Saprospiraceae bacterium]|nr:glyoxalase [Saprospiraceae bacterium]